MMVLTPHCGPYIPRVLWYDDDARVLAVGFLPHPHNKVGFYVSLPAAYWQGCDGIIDILDVVCWNVRFTTSGGEFRI